MILPSTGQVRIVNHILSFESIDIPPKRSIFIGGSISLFPLVVLIDILLISYFAILFPKISDTQMLFLLSLIIWTG